MILRSYRPVLKVVNEEEIVTNFKALPVSICLLMPGKTVDSKPGHNCQLLMIFDPGMFKMCSRNETGRYVKFEVFPAVTTKNAVFWDIKTQFVPHGRHITSPLQSTAS
jgi:hypothetical protein